MTPKPRPRRPAKQRTPFSSGDQSQLNSAAVVADAEASRIRLTKMRAGLEEYRRAGADEPPVDPDRPHPTSHLNRADGLLPFLAIRTFIGDSGARPIDPTIAPRGYVSPDILIVAALPVGSPAEPGVRDRMQVDAAFRSRIQFSIAINTPYDVWVHVWNLGRAAAFGVRVRAWLQVWGSPPPGSFIGGRRLDLGDRTSDTAHRLVCVGRINLPHTEYAGIWANAECITDASAGTTEEALTSPIVNGTGRYDDAWLDRHTAFTRIQTL